MDQANYKDFVIEIILRIVGQKGFEVLPRRWVVERTFRRSFVDDIDCNELFVVALNGRRSL